MNDDVDVEAVVTDSVDDAEVAIDGPEADVSSMVPVDVDTAEMVKSESEAGAKVVVEIVDVSVSEDVDVLGPPVDVEDGVVSVTVDCNAELKDFVDVSGPAATADTVVADGVDSDVVAVVTPKAVSIGGTEAETVAVPVPDEEPDGASVVVSVKDGGLGPVVAEDDEVGESVVEDSAMGALAFEVVLP